MKVELLRTTLEKLCTILPSKEIIWFGATKKEKKVIINWINSTIKVYVSGTEDKTGISELVKLISIEDDFEQFVHNTNCPFIVHFIK